jgi:ubiquinone biosynthesis protein
MTEQNPQETIRLINVAMSSYMMQLLKKSFLHADPHQGNLIKTHDGRLAILDFGFMEYVSEADKEGILRAIINLTNRDYSNIISNFSDLGLLSKYIDNQKYQPNFAAAFDTVLTRSAKDVTFSDVTRGLIEATLDMPFGLP